MGDIHKLKNANLTKRKMVAFLVLGLYDAHVACLSAFEPQTLRNCSTSLSGKVYFAKFSKFLSKSSLILIVLRIRNFEFSFFCFPISDFITRPCVVSGELISLLIFRFQPLPS